MNLEPKLETRKRMEREVEMLTDEVVKRIDEANTELDLLRDKVLLNGNISEEAEKIKSCLRSLEFKIEIISNLAAYCQEIKPGKE
jgi:arginine deiminase